jgi:hypothetical protein
MSYFKTISYADTGALDAFNRLRTSSPETLFSTQTQYNAATLQMEVGATGTGVVPTHSANTRMVALSCSTGSGTSFTQSYQYSPYQPGRSQFIACTGVIGAGVSGAVVDFGYFDATNGVIFRQNGNTNLQLILRTSTGGSVSDANIVNQSAWNIDGLNSGINSLNPSGLTLDITKAQILIIDLQFLGMGRVRVGFDINGIIYYVHQFTNANNLSVPYMQTATLPVCMLITGTGLGSVKTSYFKCATVQSEGGSLSGFGFSFATPEILSTPGNGVRVPMVSIRPKVTFNGITNRELFLLDTISIFTTANQDVFWELVLGGTYGGQTWADVDTNNSAFEYTSVPGTFTNLTGGIVLATGYNSRLGGTNNGSPIVFEPLQSLKYPLTLNRAGAQRALGTLTLLGTGVAGNAASRCTVNFKEIR